MESATSRYSSFFSTSNKILVMKSVQFHRFTDRLLCQISCVSDHVTSCDNEEFLKTLSFNCNREPTETDFESIDGRVLLFECWIHDCLKE